MDQKVSTLCLNKTVKPTEKSFKFINDNGVLIEYNITIYGKFYVYDTS